MSNLLRISALLLALQIDFAFATPDEDMFFNDWEDQAQRVSEGELRLLPPEETRQVHEHINHIVISKESLDDGWTRMNQCHENLDALDAVQISYRKSTTKNHQIESISNIGRAWVEDGNIELEAVKEGAKICVSLDTKSLHRRESDRWSMKNGPFMRKFLDGYYPMHVVMNVDYPCDEIRFVESKITEQIGYKVTEQQCAVNIDATFEGKLSTELVFERLRFAINQESLGR